jgi:hypothetical protein
MTVCIWLNVSLFTSIPTFILEISAPTGTIQILHTLSSSILHS